MLRILQLFVCVCLCVDVFVSVCVCLCICACVFNTYPLHDSFDVESLTHIVFLGGHIKASHSSNVLCDIIVMLRN